MEGNADEGWESGRAVYESGHRKRGDIDLESVASEQEDYDSGPSEYEITAYPADFTLEVLHSKWKNGDIEIPDFQREFVWKQVQASKLIESFMVGLPVPPVFFYKERATEKLLVIDGQQRLRSVFYYFEGYFGDERQGKRTVFALKGLNKQSKYLGKAYHDLDQTQQRRLQNCVLRSFLVQQLNPRDDTSIYHVFERLNTGGTLLANQEVRNCVYRGAFNELLHELNKLGDWRGILGKQPPDARKKDIELILRFFSLLSLNGYRKPMKDHLSLFMSRNREPGKVELTAFRRQFEDTCKAVVAALGEKPFHIRAGLNAAAFDCVMVAFALHSGRVPKDIAQRYESLKANPQFADATRSGTTDEDTIKRRRGLAQKTLFGG